MNLVAFCPRPLRRPAAVAAVLALGVAAAQAEPGRFPLTYFQAGIGTGLARATPEPTRQGDTDWMLGFRFNPLVAVQLVGFRLNTPFQPAVVTGAPPQYGFTRFVGAQVVGFLPATSYWDLYGELGAGQARLTSAWPGAAAENQTNLIWGAGVRWQMFDHVAATLDITRLTRTRVTNPSARVEFNF